MQKKAYKIGLWVHGKINTEANLYWGWGGGGGGARGDVLFRHALLAFL